MGIRPFTDTLRQVRFGELQDELAEKLNELTKLVSETGKVGTMKLTLKLKPGNSGQIEIIDDIAVTAPKPNKGSSIFFATPEGNLQREDPRQMNLDGIRSVSETQEPLRKVASE